MTTNTVHIVDDDSAVRDSLAWLLKSRGLKTQTWASGTDFLAEGAGMRYGCLVLDIRMPEMSGVELFDRLRQLDCPLPVIFLTGHGDVPMAVQAIKDGAFDFLEKPVNEDRLFDRVSSAMALNAANERSKDVADAISQHVEQLTARERDVMELVLAGKLNKVIADELGIAMRTVEVHRSRIFEKMGVRSAVELSQLLAGR
jgi:two-component system response regulator DctR